MNKSKIETCRNKKGFIDLNKFKNYREKGTVVEGSNAKQWFNVNGTRFLFKEYEEVLPCFGEVMYYNAAKMCGIECAEYDFALMDGKIGTISYDFLSETETYYDFLELSTQFGDFSFDLENVSNDRDLLVLKNNKYNNLSSIKDLVEELFHASTKQKKELEIELIKMFCLDTLFMHSDRNLWNYGVVVDEDVDEFRLAPVYDNSFVLYLNKGEKYIEECIVEFINDGVRKLQNNNSVYEKIIKDDDSIDQLVDFYSNSDEDIRDIIDSVIKSLNVEKVFEETCQKCKIDEVSSLWIKAMLNFRQKTILSELESVKINDDEAQRPSIVFNKKK